MNILVTGAWSCAKDYIEQIENSGNNVIFMQCERDELPCSYDWVEAVICNGLFLYQEIEKFANLRLIQLTSAGFDRVPMEYIKENKIDIYNARGVYSVPMAEFALCGVLQIYKESRFFFKNQSEHKWEKHRGLKELIDKKVCIVGCGSVGNECAKRFKAFGCRVIGIDIVIRQDYNYDQMFPLSELKRKVSDSDIIVITVPLTEQTKHMFDNKMFEAVKSSVIVVNIARGAIIDTKSLVQGLQSGTLGGAVIDVFDDEPLDQNSPLWDMDNAIITPHNSFVGEFNGARLSGLIMKNLEILG